MNLSIPIAIGVTGHRNLRSEDIPQLNKIVREEMKKIVDAYPNLPIIMINSLAEGADQLCAEAALELGISLVAPLPMTAAEYRKDFTGEACVKFDNLCSAASEVFVAPHTEFEQEQTRDYCYRQAGIYVASHSHVLLALWDGSEATMTGCGTAETVGFMLDTNYAGSAGSLFRTAGDGAVIHIVTPRTNAPMPEDAFSVRLIENVGGLLGKVLSDTDSFNKDAQAHMNK